MTTTSNSTNLLPVPIVNLGMLYANGCEISVATATTLTVQPGQLRDSTNTVDIVVNSTLGVDSSISGAFGVDTGTIAASTFYAVYIVSDTTNQNPPATLLSLSSITPTMPAVNGVTYSAYRLIGYVKTDGSSNFLAARIMGNGNMRYNDWDVPINVLTGGTATTFTAVSLAAGIPSGIGLAAIENDYLSSVRFQSVLSFTPAAAGNYVNFTSGNSAGAGGARLSASVAAVPTQDEVDLTADFVIAGGRFEVKYLNSAAACAATIGVGGFQYFI